MAKLKDLSLKPERLTGGHRLCPGCGVPAVARMALLATDAHLVVGASTGCLEVSTTIYPYTAWQCSFIHNAFENVAATISGVEAAYKALKKRGKIKDEFKFIAFGGDGGTYDIGIQSLSGAMERGHDMVYICYDNEAYQNTGNQRSSSTPMGSNTTTTPVGKESYGSVGRRKDLTAIMAAHHIPYVAQTTSDNWKDLNRKLARALEVEGPAFLNILTPCVPGWKYDGKDTINLSRLAAKTCFWPSYEVDHGKWKLNYTPKEKLPVVDFLKPQGRFRHLFSPENQHVIDELQREVDDQWEELLVRCGKK
ncbi:pyruvate ferredoxin oxidoreductase [candidate division LCP-89 bacterium B3_LCP]|uniref:Pyruvate ferredoxin oxidoreductase n=1 Tax=candidate division LCP-89 bacterium B3_LCP TaxID=2012998 RepID=A0A532V5B0_UNCL8|nr:MAG: pyruvate ferredoxin oxidoreductase [candidate division LCP-89 bacterium B3_LCP]